MSRTATTSLLATIGTLALAIITVAHLHRLPGVDGWIGVAGGLLMLAAATTDHHQRPRAAVTPAAPKLKLAAWRAAARATAEARPSRDQ